jgi:predicted nucleotidyltransferase
MGPGGVDDATDAADRERLIAALERALRARPEIVFACLHGSFLTGLSYRDIDVAVWLDETRLGRDDRGRWTLDLSVALQMELRRLVDVRALNDASLAFRYHALRGRPLAVRDRERFDDVRARTWDDYFDFAPLARESLRGVLGE